MMRRTVLKAGLVLAATSHSPVTVAEVPSDILAELGSRFDKAYALEEAARIDAQQSGDWTAWDAAFERTTSIVDQIEQMPASTLEELRIKARCIQWCSDSDAVDVDVSGARDTRLAQQIISALLKSRASS